MGVRMSFFDVTFAIPVGSFKAGDKHPHVVIDSSRNTLELRATDDTPTLTFGLKLVAV